MRPSSSSGRHLRQGADSLACQGNALSDRAALQSFSAYGRAKTTCASIIRRGAARPIQTPPDLSTTSGTSKACLQANQARTRTFAAALDGHDVVSGAGAGLVREAAQVHLKE